MTDERDPIPAEQARQILEAGIREHLGEDWEEIDTGWVRVTGHDYMARLTNGRTNLDFYVDLTGQLRVEKSDISIAQDSGRLVAIILLLLSVAIALLVVRIVSGGG
jgi:hypothetical protein